jgi:glycosyltransferase involved in cell wall biosynthesis
LCRVTEAREIVALHAPDQTTPYPIEVHHRIRRDEPADYLKTARSLTACVDVVSIQYGRGIWGGEDGDAVLDFTGALEVPAVATLHSLPGTPEARERDVLVELVRLARVTVVMSQIAATRLTTVYGADPKRVEIIPHGVPDLPLIGAESIKPGLGLDGRRVILSLGLLAPGKGHALVLDALPAVVAAHPDLLYVIVGPTHPDELGEHGEAYRTSLVAKVKALGLTDHVQFVDRWVGRVELTRWLESADVYVTPYADLDRVVSGELSYAMGAGRAIVSTPYAYAAEQLADGRGILSAAASPDAFATALNGLLGDEEARLQMGHLVYEGSRRMVWREVGADYRKLFARVAAGQTAPGTSTRSAAMTA